MSMLCKEKSYKFSKILEKYLANSFYPLQKGVFILYRSFWTARNNLEKTEKIYKNNLTYLISMLLYNHVENTYITDMNNGGISYEQDFR